MDETPGSYQELATFLSRTIFSQIASPDDVGHAVRGDAEPTGANSDHVPPPQDPLERPATECIAVPPPSACCPPPGVEPDVAAEHKYLGELHADLANITTKANVHACTFTCHKRGSADSCRYVCKPSATFRFVRSNPPRLGSRPNFCFRLQQSDDIARV